MIEFVNFTYSDAQWSAIKVVVREALGGDADRIKRQVTHGDITGTLTLRDDIETAASVYRVDAADARQSPGRAELIAIRDDAERLRARITDAFAVQIGVGYGLGLTPWPRPGVTRDLLDATGDHFAMLRRALDRQIERAGSRGDNARKPARDEFWSKLLTLWVEIGGKPSGTAAARFLCTAVGPVMSKSPTVPSIMRWLERRQSKPDKVARRRAAR